VRIPLRLRLGVAPLLDMNLNDHRRLRSSAA
jgi:hypothetical protein